MPEPMPDKPVIFLPARYASSRYPGKPLAMLTGATGQAKPLIQRSWEAAMAVPGAHVYVLTDDARIHDTARAFGARVLMTSPNCQNGTERCAEGIGLLEHRPQIVVNLQGDAPLTPPWYIEGLIDAMRADPSVQVATPVLRCTGRHLAQLKADRQAGRVGGTTAVFDHMGNALYFSKEVMPFTSQAYPEGAPTPVFHHVGVYAYTPAALDTYMRLPASIYERLEGLEQLRFVENAIAVKCVEVAPRGHAFWELNNPADIAIIEAILRKGGMA